MKMNQRSKKGILFPGFERERVDLKRRADEPDGDYRERVRAVISGNDTFARLDSFNVAGACLDDFASSVAHAAYIGWRGAAGAPHAHHRKDCQCPSEIRRRTRRAEETIRGAEEAIRAALEQKQAAEAELAHLRRVAQKLAAEGLVTADGAALTPLARQLPLGDKADP